MSLESITDEENKKSLHALELLEKGIPGALVSEAAVQRGIDRGLYEESRVIAAQEAYPTRMKKWLRNVCSPATIAKSSSDEKTHGYGHYGYEVGLLNKLLADDETLTPEKFAIFRSIIEEEIFPAARALRVPGINQIIQGYNLELVQSRGGANSPSAGRLSYIKEHLRALQEKLQELKP